MPRMSLDLWSLPIHEHWFSLFRSIYGSRVSGNTSRHNGVALMSEVRRTSPTSFCNWCNDRLQSELLRQSKDWELSAELKANVCEIFNYSLGNYCCTIQNHVPVQVRIETTYMKEPLLQQQKKITKNGRFIYDFVFSSIFLVSCPFQQNWRTHFLWLCICLKQEVKFKEQLYKTSEQAIIIVSFK